MEIILASQSKDRKKILQTLGIPFKIFTSNIDESSYNQSINDPKTLVQKLAELKAIDVKNRIKDKFDLGIIIAADTVVEFQDEIIGKAKSKEDAFRILKLLSGEEHNLISGYAIASTIEDKIFVDFDKTLVKFSHLSEENILYYIKLNEWKGRAGAYSIRERASLFIEWIKGSFSNVLGLPMDKIFQALLREFGINLLSIKNNQKF